MYSPFSYHKICTKARYVSGNISNSCGCMKNIYVLINNNISHLCDCDHDREVWTDDECFGATNATADEELMILRDIFLTDLGIGECFNSICFIPIQSDQWILNHSRCNNAEYSYSYMCEYRISWQNVSMSIQSKRRSYGFVYDPEFMM